MKYLGCCLPVAHPSSVAVLPLADLSAEKDQEYFADGMTEELLQALGKIEGLMVPSRTAVFALGRLGIWSSTPTICMFV